jgi:hypothetical protein
MFDKLYADRNVLISNFQNLSTYPLQSSKFKATLIISSPRLLYDQVKRSHLYDFNPGIVNELQDMVLKSTASGLNTRVASMMQPQMLMSSAIIPDGAGIKMDTHEFSDYWSFYLVIDNLNFNINNTVSIANLSNTNRMVISGFCSEEPLNPSNHGAGHTFNPRCIFTPTHYIYFNLSGSGPDQPPVIRFHTSHDIVVNTAMNHVVKQHLPTDDYGLALLRPNDYHLSNSYANYNEVTDSYDIVHYVDQDQMLNGNLTNPVINTNFHVPKYHIANILDTSMKAALRFSNDNLSIADLTNENIPMDQRYTAEFDTINQSKNTEIINQYVFDPCSPIEFNRLLSVFPDITVVPLFIPRECAWNVVSQENMNPSTIYTSVVASALPAIMSRYNLSEVMFRYSSWVQNPDGSMGTYEVKHFATHIAVPSNIAAISWQNFINAVETEVFPVLIHRIGHFDIFISCQSIGYIQIDLHALDFHSDYDQGVYESYNFLGGLNTPLVGTIQHRNSNEKELLRLTSTLGHNLNDFYQKSIG